MEYLSLDEIIRDLETNPIESHGNIYHPIPFPEFAHLKTSSDSSEVYAKWALIKKTVKSLYPEGSPFKVLDIGANGGFYSFSLAGEGAEVTAFEPHPRYAEVGQFLALHKSNERVTWYANSFNCSLVHKKTFDVALMLSVFQWMADGGSRMDEAVEELKGISRISKYLFFELGYNKGKSCLKTTQRNHYAALIDFLSRNTFYSYFKYIGTTKLWGCPRYLVLCSNDEAMDDCFFRKYIRRITV